MWSTVFGFPLDSVPQIQYPSVVEHTGPFRGEHPMINVLIVTLDARFISTQAESWQAAAAWVAEKGVSGVDQYVNVTSPVFFSDVSARNVRTQRLEQHTVGSVIDDVRNGRV